MKVVYHNNEWYWGNTTTIITEGCMGTVELQYDNNYPTVAFIKDLSVHKSARKCGIGNTLLKLCYQEALKKGKKFLQLNVLQDSWLVKWYERKGFTTIYKDEHELTMLKSLRPQPKQEWSQNDIDMIDWLIRCCEKEHEELCNDKYGHQDIVSDLKRDCRKKWNWLESLKNKVVPQNKWKPSNEQIEILDMVLSNESMDDNVARILRDIREQLKRLREE